MEVSLNGGTLKSSILIGFSVITSILGYPYFWKPPYNVIVTVLRGRRGTSGVPEGRKRAKSLHGAIMLELSTGGHWHNWICGWAKLKWEQVRQNKQYKTKNHTKFVYAVRNNGYNGTKSDCGFGRLDEIRGQGGIRCAPSTLEV